MQIQNKQRAEREREVDLSFLGTKERHIWKDGKIVCCGHACSFVEYTLEDFIADERRKMEEKKKED